MAWVRCWLALAISVILLFIAVWIVIPAPTSGLLKFGVGAPEVSGWILVTTLAAILLAVGEARRRRPARLAVAVAGAALVLGSLVPARFPATARRFDAAMRAGLGDDYLGDVPAEIRQGMRSHPAVLQDLFLGIDCDEVPVTRGIPFAAPGGVPLTMDVYRSPVFAPSPILVQIYGGSWQRGDPSKNTKFARYMASRGYVVFALDYRHAPRWTWPTQLADVDTALAWILRHAGEYGGDPARIALIGRSAGAHLALMAAYQPEGTPVRAVVSYYGPVDLVEAYRSPPHPDPLDIVTLERAFIGGTLEEMPVRYLEASPIHALTNPLPPTLLVYAGRDHVVEARFGRTLDARLRANGTRSILLEIPWAEHAFDAVWNGPSSQLALYHTERFLAWALYRP